MVSTICGFKFCHIHCHTHPGGLPSDDDTAMSTELIDLTEDTTDNPGDFNIDIKPKKTSIDPTYSTEVENPQPGDLVLGTLDDVKHPAKEDKHFGPRYLILGAVKGFAPVPLSAIQAWMRGVKFRRFVKKEKLEIAWQNISSGRERYIQIASYNKSRYFNHTNHNNRFYNIRPTAPYAVTILKKADDERMGNMNIFLWNTVNENFTWNTKDGWAVRKPFR